MKIKQSFIMLFAIMILMVTTATQAALTVSQSRYIFEGSKDSISIVVENGTNKAYGGQTWIENIREADSRPTFVVTPPFFKIAGEGKQVLRVIKALDDMPDDKESIYWVNLQEIPPANKEGGLSIALRTKVKLLYRPENLMAGRKDAESNLSVDIKGEKVTLSNRTPYIFAIADLLDNNNNPLSLNDSQHATLAMFSPGDSLLLPSGSKIQKILAIDDYGYLRTHILNKNK